MKNLKKILIVMVVLALLAVSAFAVIAADDTEASVDKLNEYIASVKADQNPSTKSVTLRDMFAYHNSNDWSDNPDGYEAAMAEAYALVVSVGEEIEAKLAAEEALEKPDAKILKNNYDLLNAHFIGCDVPAGTTGLAGILAKLEARNVKELETLYTAYNTANTSGARVLDKVREAIQKLFDKFNSIYPINDQDLIKKYKDAAYELVKELIDDYAAIPRNESQITEAHLADATIVTNAEKAKLTVSEYAAKLFYFDRVNKIVLIDNLVKAANFDASAELTEIKAEIATYIKAKDAEIAEKRAALDLLSDFDSYDLPMYFDKNYDGNLSVEEINKLSKDEQKKYKEQNELFTAYNQAAEHKTAIATEYYEDENGKLVADGFQTLIYGNGATVPHLYIEPSLAGKAEDHGMVIDFDLRMFNNLTKDTGYTMYSVDNSFGSGNSKFHTFLHWTRDKDTNEIYITNESSQTKTIAGANLAKFYNAFSLEVWNHYTVTYDAEKKLGTLYINYEKVLDLYFSPDYAMRGLRWGPTAIPDFRWDIDDVKFYAGTAYRITDKFEKMSDGEKFKFYIDYAAEASYPYLYRNTAYKRAQLLLPKFEKDFSYASYVTKFNGINYEEDIKKNAMVDNLTELTDLVKVLVGAEAFSLDGMTDEEISAEIEKYPGLPLTSDNVAAVNKQISKINEFVSKNGDLINKGDTSKGGYQELMGFVYSTEANIKHVENAVAFVGAVEKFYRATTLAALTRHSLAAEEIYNLAGFSEAEIREFVEEDIVIRTFENKYNNTVVNGEGKSVVLSAEEGLAVDGTVVKLAENEKLGEEALEIVRYPILPDDEEYVTIFEFYNAFAEIMAVREKYENSRRIVNCVDYIVELEGYENTTEFFAANYETIAPYMTIIRDMVRTNAYDHAYVGVDEALEIFWELDIYFYKVLQQEHITYIGQMLAKYPLTNAYIEKLSIVRSMQDYFATEDLATTNANMSVEVAEVVAEEKAQLAELKLVLEVYSSEIAGLSDVYEDILEQQTQYFINTVNHMKTLKTLAEIEELYAIATSYYYGINVNTEGAPEAIAVYNEYRAMLAEADKNAELLEIVAEAIDDASALSGMEKRSAIYAALKEGAVYVQNLDDTSISAKIALQTYQLALADYITENAAFNDAIFESEQITNAVRSGKLSPTVLAVISSIIAAN